MPNEQTIGEVENVDDMPNILAEQAAAAASTKSEGATEMKEETTVEETVEEPDYVPKPEITPDDELDANLADKFKIAQGKKAEAPTKPEVKSKAQPRVLDDLDEPLRPVFKNMSNDSFNTLKPIILQAKKDAAKIAELNAALEDSKKGKIPDSYYEHEMAYVLTPEFSELSATVDTAQNVHSHWERQLSDIRSGAESYIPLVRDAQGNIVQGQPIKVDKHTLTQLEGVRNEVQNFYLAQKAKMDGMASSHRERVNSHKSWVNDFNAKAFPAFDTDATLKGLAADTVKTFPAIFHNNPLMPVVSRLMVLSAQLGQALKAAQTAKPAAAKPQPSAATIAGGGTGGKGAALNDDDDLAGAFDRAKKGLL